MNEFNIDTTRPRRRRRRKIIPRTVATIIYWVFMTSSVPIAYFAAKYVVGPLLEIDMTRMPF